MPDNSVDLIFADPPYRMLVDGSLARYDGNRFDGCMEDWDQFRSMEDYELFTKTWLAECHRVLKPNGSIWVIGGMQCIYTIGAIMQQLGFWFVNDVVWHKKNPTPNFRGSRLNNSHETLIWAAKSKKAAYTFNYKTAKELNSDTVTPVEFSKGTRKQLGSVWHIGVCQGGERLKDENGAKLHSTQKPEELLYRIIAISSKKGDIVLDPFGGTMTTAAAAKRLGRRYVMIERNKIYCEYGQRRLDEVQYEDSPVANASFDVKPVKAPMTDMIKSGYFTAGESFCFSDGKPIATLNEDGTLTYNGQKIDMHACAALARNMKAKRLNGFLFWCVMRDDALVPIDEIREQYRTKLLCEKCEEKVEE